MIQERVYIIVLNYKNLTDTIECLESLFLIDYGNAVVVVVDNDSQDGSIEGIQNWADGTCGYHMPKSSPLDELRTCFVKKPLKYTYIKEGCEPIGASLEQKLVIIAGNDNRGYAAGNNKGVRYAMARGDCKYVWLLNNDTVVDRYVLSYQVKQMQTFSMAERQIGILGHKLNYYYSPDRIQAIGGIYNRFMASAKHLGEGELDFGQYNESCQDKNIDYPIGASLFVNVEFIKDVGLLTEDYFLYYEEIDWVVRGKRRGWELGYCGAGKIYHKEGSSAGSSMNANKVGYLSDFYSVANKLIVTRNLYPHLLPFAAISFLLSIVNRLRRGHFKKAKNLIIWNRRRF
ncbi:MAG: glycosyltransferase family 2 protein [Pseudomonadales bacterium]|nr:glycosyltransferase family 2 protein [Pseudomonadales bacterium]